MWESIKATEKQRTRSPTDSRRGCRRCSTPTRCSTGSTRPAARSAAGGHDIGERLLALVAEARETGVDPEQALRDAVRRLL